MFRGSAERAVKRVGKDATMENPVVAGVLVALVVPFLGNTLGAALVLFARVNFFLGPLQSRGVARPLHGLFLSRLLGLLLTLFEPFRHLMLSRRHVGRSSNRDDGRGRGWS